MIRAVTDDQHAHRVSTVEAESSDRELKIAVMVVTSTENARDVMRFMRSVHPATYVSEIREA